MFDFVMNISFLKNMFTFLFCLLVTELCQRRLQPPLNPIANSQHQQITNTAVTSTKQKKGSARQVPLLSERCCPTERFLSRSHSVETGPIDDIGSGPMKCHQSKFPSLIFLEPNSKKCLKIKILWKMASMMLSMAPN